MAFKVIGDSCCDFTKLQMKKGNVVRVPMSVIIGGVEYRDDGRRTQEEWIKLIKEDPGYPQSACPSPEEFMNAFDEKCDNYVVTLSSKLSGVYNSAMVAKDMFEDEHEDAKIHIFDSKSTSVKETMIVLMVKELEEQGLPFEEIVEKTEAMIYNADTYFTLDNLETLRKNGRLSKMKGLAATLLKIKPICFGNKDGEIEQIGQARGSNKALLKMVEMIAKNTVDPENKVLGISHTNCHERAVMVRDAILARIKVKEVVMVETAGLSTTYANDGGIIVVI